MCCECQVEARAMPKDFLLRFSLTLMYEKVVDSLINLFATRKPNQSLWTDCGTACTESNCSIQQFYASSVWLLLLDRGIRATAQIIEWVSSVFSGSSVFTHRVIYHQTSLRKLWNEFHLFFRPRHCSHIEQSSSLHSRARRGVIPRLFKRPSRGRTLAGLENIALNITTRFVVSFRNMPELSFHIVTCNGSTNKNGTCEEFSCSYCLD